jgi:hypothetical protein
VTKQIDTMIALSLVPASCCIDSLDTFELPHQQIHKPNH